MDYRLHINVFHVLCDDKYATKTYLPSNALISLVSSVQMGYLVVNSTNFRVTPIGLMLLDLSFIFISYSVSALHFPYQLLVEFRQTITSFSLN